MRFSLRLWICLGAGVVSALAGWALIKSQKPKPEDTSFVSALSPSAFVTTLGWILVMLSLFLFFILSPMFYIAG
ncbi:MAG: hypothetical protein HY926_08725 [Elusimicrobia bacterium]|nr:hypothetical protein [Elusimicrobiota bacterium]